MPSKQVRKQLQAQYDRRITEAKEVKKASKPSASEEAVAAVAAKQQASVNDFLTAYSTKSDAEKADFGKFVKKYGKSFDKSVNKSVKKQNFGTYAKAKTTAAAAKADILAGKADAMKAGLGSKIQKVEESEGKHKFVINLPAYIKASIPSAQKKYRVTAGFDVKEKYIDKSINKAKNARVALGKALGFKEDKNRVKRPATQFVRKQAKNERQNPDVRGI